MQVAQDNVLRIYGTEGSLVVPTPWIPGQDATITLQRRRPARGDRRPRRPRRLRLEADVVADHLPRRQPPPPAMTWDDTLGDMRDARLVAAGDRVEVSDGGVMKPIPGVTTCVGSIAVAKMLYFYGKTAEG